jgi:hypothetical protein
MSAYWKNFSDQFLSIEQGRSEQQAVEIFLLQRVLFLRSDQYGA